MSRNKIKAIFLTNKSSLHSEVTGGVQICSQEFYDVLDSSNRIELRPFYVNFTKRIKDRLAIKVGFENYSMYDVGAHEKQLLEFIEKESIEVVFINMASLVRFSKPIKERFRDRIKVVLLSHGNHSGDFLHLLNKPISGRSRLKLILMRYRLGNLLGTESLYRDKYVDAVIALSETEKQIEHWLGALNCLFFPRRLKANFIPYNPTPGRFGFVGRLDHPPNVLGVRRLLEEMDQLDNKGNIEIRLVGAPIKDGEQLAKGHDFVTYLGELSDRSLELEAETWSAFLNPVWWYSTGATTKIAKAISWGVPIISTVPGIRGYDFRDRNLIIVNGEREMVNAIMEIAENPIKSFREAENVKAIAQSSYTAQELSKQLLQMLKV